MTFIVQDVPVLTWKDVLLDVFFAETQTMDAQCANVKRRVSLYKHSLGMSWRLLQT